MLMDTYVRMYVRRIQRYSTYRYVASYLRHTRTIQLAGQSAVG